MISELAGMCKVTFMTQFKVLVDGCLRIHQLENLKSYQFTLLSQQLPGRIDEKH